MGGYFSEILNKKEKEAIKDTPQTTGHTQINAHAAAPKGHLGWSGSLNQIEQVAHRRSTDSEIRSPWGVRQQANQHSQPITIQPKFPVLTVSLAVCRHI